MAKYTLIVIPDRSSESRQFRVSGFFIKISMLLALGMAVVAGYFALDYVELLKLRVERNRLVKENQTLKGEAQLLSNNLDVVKNSLEKVEDYAQKLADLVGLKAKKLEKKTGIGPLNQEEFKVKEDNLLASESAIPLGLSIDNLVFKPVLSKMAQIERTANSKSHKLQHLLASLSKKKSLLSATPSLKPTNGWITSSFGTRISPFTGKKSHHRGIDIACQKGTPIYAPADGVVIFSGAKAGFGNFIMIAHGNGIVTRYGHNAQNMVRVDQKVYRGDQIASVGMTGRTTGPHLHYEIWVKGRPVNPKKFIVDSLF